MGWIVLLVIIGIVLVFINRKSETGTRGFLFLRIMLIFWLCPMTFMGVKFLRYTLDVIPVVYMTAAIGAVAAWRLGVNAVKAFGRSVRDLGRASRTTLALAGSIPRAVLGIFVLWPAAAAITYLPYPALYTNCLGGGRVGYFFPHDEFYDLGARESIRYIAAHATNGAIVATEIPAVLEYYLERYGRSDIRSEVMSHPGFSLASPPPDFVLMQPGRIYFENVEQLAIVESAFEIAQSSTYEGVAATRVYQSQPRALAAPPVADDSGESRER